MLKNADYIYDNIIIADDKETTKEYCQIAQVGVDLSVKEILELADCGAVTREKSYVATYKRKSFDKKFKYGAGKKGWFLTQGTYIVLLNEGCRFGPKDTGFIITRSSLNRNGVGITSAVWDPGYTSLDGETVHPMSVRLTVNNPMGFWLEKNARIAQLVVLENENTYSYSGQFQGGVLKTNVIINAAETTK